MELNFTATTAAALFFGQKSFGIVSSARIMEIRVHIEVMHWGIHPCSASITVLVCIKVSIGVWTHSCILNTSSTLCTQLLCIKIWSVEAIAVVPLISFCEVFSIICICVIPTAPISVRVYCPSRIIVDSIWLHIFSLTHRFSPLRSQVKYTWGCNLCLNKSSGRNCQSDK